MSVPALSRCDPRHAHRHRQRRDHRHRRPLRLRGRPAHAPCRLRLPQPGLPQGREVFPFILLPIRIRRGWLAPPAMQLIYCRDIADYVAYAGAIGRHLLAPRQDRRHLRRQRPHPRPGRPLYRSPRPQIFQGPAAAAARRPHRHRTGDLRTLTGRAFLVPNRDSSASGGFPTKISKTTPCKVARGSPAGMLYPRKHLATSLLPLPACGRAIANDKCPERGRCFGIVMAGLVPAIHVLRAGTK